MLRSLCKTHTHLNNHEIAYLEILEKFLPLIAEMVDADIFIDCILGIRRRLQILSGA